MTNTIDRYSTHRAAIGTILSTEELMTYAPSIFTGTAFPGMSNEYKHIPTIDIVNHLQDNKFYPVQVKQSGDPNSIKSLFARHSIAFRYSDPDSEIYKGDLIPEILLKNAHDGSGSYSLTAGLFRIICLNGLVVGEGDTYRIVMRHMGSNNFLDKVLDNTKRIVSLMPTLKNKVDRLRDKKLDKPKQMNFAVKALRLAPTRLSIDPSELLVPRRAHDMNEDAWTIMNVVQENLIRGGVPGYDRNGSVRRTASIRDLDKDTTLNRALWDLAEAA